MEMVESTKEISLKVKCMALESSLKETGMFIPVHFKEINLMVKLKLKVQMVIYIKEMLLEE
jgi:hypothetical protein